MGIDEVVTAPRSPWQNPYVERVLASYVAYYHQSRTHLSLDKDCPEPRPTQPPQVGTVIALLQVGGLHYRYERVAA